MSRDIWIVTPDESAASIWQVEATELNIIQGAGRPLTTENKVLKVSIMPKWRDAALFMTLMTNTQEKCRVWDRLPSNGAVVEVGRGEKPSGPPGGCNTEAGLMKSGWVPHSLLGASFTLLITSAPRMGQGLRRQNHTPPK